MAVNNNEGFMAKPQSAPAFSIALLFFYWRGKEMKVAAFTTQSTKFTGELHPPGCGAGVTSALKEERGNKNSPLKTILLIIKTISRN